MGRKTKAKEIKRPFATHYFSDLNARENAYASQGAASSERGAIRATVVHVFMQEWAKALIYDRRTGVLIYTVKVTSHGIQVYYGATAETQHLRRVK
jgi:hypothetical protein